MTQYAYFDHAASQPAPVIGWYDTGILTYPNLPAAADLLNVTPEQWTARMANPSGWAVQAGALVAYTPPEPVLTLAQQAATAAVSGITLTISGSLILAATLFPTDTATQGKLNAVVTAINATGGFPGGSATYPIKDASGAWHTFMLGQYKAVAGAIAAYVAACGLIADGNPVGVAALPPAAASVVFP
jgi:hypothetical protein